MSTSGKCPFCSKTVYINESKLYEGGMYHASCFSKFMKQKQEEELRSRGTFNPQLHGRVAVNAGDGTGGKVALDGKSAVEPEVLNRIAALSPRTAEERAETVGPTGSKFCSGCGAPNRGAKFCADCGHKF